jgi:hypothetical protein
MTINEPRKTIYKEYRNDGVQSSLQTSPPSRLVAAGTARAAGAVGVAGVAGESRVAAGAEAAGPAILMSPLPVPVVAAWRLRRVGRWLSSDASCYGCPVRAQESL